MSYVTLKRDQKVSQVRQSHMLFCDLFSKQKQRRSVIMENLKVTPNLIQELQKFEEKKNIYMLDEDQQKESENKSKQKKSFKYFFQHPYPRLLAPCVVTVLNVYMFADDPISHSIKDCHISGVGNLYSLVFSNYPPNGFSALKVFLWLFALMFGVIVGKIVIHYWLFCTKLKLKLFSKEGQGAWIVTFMFTIVILFYQSTIYNAFLTMSGEEWDEYHCTSNLHIANKTFMKGAAVATWLGNFFMVWMVLDMMLQEKKYKNWMKQIRPWWKDSILRVVAFWFVCFAACVVFITGITVDFFKWENINRDFVSTNELSRAFMASVIIILNLIIVMQDWDFPHFSGATDIKPPGISSKGLSIQIPNVCSIVNRELRIEGKWFNYSVLFVIMIINLNQWKNQIYYDPLNYGQYTDTYGYIYTVTNRSYLNIANATMLSYKYRQNEDNASSDHRSTSKFLNFSIAVKGTAFLPALFMFLVFVYLTYKYAAGESDSEKMVRDWYKSKFVKKRKSRRVEPMIINDDSDSENDNADEIPAIEKNNTTKFHYIFQHPFVRLLVAYTGVFLSWMVIAEDPIGHSHIHAKADVIGNVFTLVFGSYPDKAEYALLKIFVWCCGLLSGMWIGKFLIHQLLLNAILKLRIFRKGQGSWTIMFIMTIVMLYVWSLVFNKVADLDSQLKEFYITNEMYVKYTTFMKGVGLVSFFSHFVFVLMVTDTILQEKHYPNWARPLRRIWKGKYLRIIIMWTIGLAVAVIAIVAIIANLFDYESISSSSTNELGRACLAASVIMFDVIILMQDWEFPRFKPNQTIKLPGLSVSQYHFKMCCLDFELRGKWFTYSLIGLILFIDGYNYKNQLIYEPTQYGQFRSHNDYIVSIIDTQVLHGNQTLIKGYIYKDNQINTLNAKFLGYNDATRYSVSLLLIVFPVVFCIWFGVQRSREIKEAEGISREKRMEIVPKIENLKPKNNTLKVKHIGNLRPNYST